MLLGTAYVGPVAGLQRQYLGTSAGEIVGGTDGNDFINLLGGDDAANGDAGDDVLDGGIGSNFLTGGSGRDVFFSDGRGGTITWSTITDWTAGEQLSLWGWRPGISRAIWDDSAGADGFKGATMFGDLNADGVIDTSVTWSGLTRANLPTPLEFDGLLWFVG
jgi:Ca2+-binding RTX toxin-like protein